MRRKAVRFLDDDGPADTTGVARASRWIAFEIPGLPPPRFAGLEVLWVDGPPPAGAVLVEQDVRRPAEPRLEPVPFAMVSVARRNPALTRVEFAARWRAEAGSMGGEAIPDDIRGLAYVQNHPVDDDPPFDALNEVWFDSLGDLRRRAEWLAARPVPSDLFDPSSSFSLHLRRP